MTINSEQKLCIKKQSRSSKVKRTNKSLPGKKTKIVHKQTYPKDYQGQEVIKQTKKLFSQCQTLFFVFLFRTNGTIRPSVLSRTLKETFLHAELRIWNAWACNISNPFDDFKNKNSSQNVPSTLVSSRTRKLAGFWGWSCLWKWPSSGTWTSVLRWTRAWSLATTSLLCLMARGSLGI